MCGEIHFFQCVGVAVPSGSSSFFICSVCCLPFSSDLLIQFFCLFFFPLVIWANVSFCFKQLFNSLNLCVIFCLFQKNFYSDFHSFYYLWVRFAAVSAALGELPACCLPAAWMQAVMLGTLSRPVSYRF